jgi:hypothetical protein
MKLSPMTDYVINLKNRTYRGRGRWDEERYFDAISYAKFLKQPLEVKMFYSDDETDVIFKDVTKRPINENGSFAIDVNGFQIAYYKSLPKYWVIHYDTIEQMTGLEIEIKDILKL